MKKRILSILLALCMLFCLVPTTAFAADCAEDLVDPVIWIHLSSDGGGYYDVLNGTWTAADFFQPGKAPKGAKITAVTPPTSPSIPVSVNVNSDGTLNCTKTENTTEPVPKSETYTVTITSDDYAPISAPLTVRQYLNAGFRGPVYFDDELLYGDTYTYTCRVNNPGENGVWSALIQDPQMFEIYKETTDTTSEPGKSIYTVHIRAIKAGARITCIDFLYVSDTTMASSKVSRGAVTGGAVRTRPLTVTAGSATITEGNALPTDLVTCTGLLNSEGRKDDRDTVLDNALGYQLLDANNEEVTAATARNMPGTYTVVPAATLKSGWGERYSLNKVNGTLTVENQPDEQFSLTPGGTYYFDLSGASIPGTANSGNSNGAASLPDTSLHYVPFTYAGTIEAYKLTSAMATTEEYAQQNKYSHSLFVADYAVTHKVNWNNLDTASLIFGKNYASGGVDYTLRAPSVGSSYTGSGDSTRGTPLSNEWDRILDKDSGYIKNGIYMHSWGQDTHSISASYRAIRGFSSARLWLSINAALSDPIVGFRPVLEVLNPGTLGSDGLKVVTLDLGGGKLGNSSEDIQIIVKTGSEFTAPASDGLTRPDGDTGSYFMWLGSNGKLYAPGDSVPADVTALTVQWTVPTYAVTLHPNGGTINSGNVTGYTYGVGATLPTAGDMTYTGHTFVGWYDNENLTGSPVTAIGGTETGNKEYWAKWEINQYTITFDTVGGSTVASITQDYGTAIAAPADPTREGYTFIGWDKEIPSTMPAENVTVTAKWVVNQYTITFDTAGGSAVASITQDYGTAITAPANPTREGYTFIGWDKAIPATMPAENMIITANWKVNQYTITFDSNGGSEIAPITQDYGTAITAPADPTREGYTFIGWDKAIPATMPAEDLTITAQWRDIAVPTGEIKIAENGWKSFLNTITFRLFFKDTQTVTVTAADNSGEAVKIEYLLSDKALTESELAGKTFTAYSAPFSINPDNEYVIYAKLTDTSGNFAYINTNGIVLDATVPGISGIADGKTYCAAQTITVDEKYIGTVKVNGTEVSLDKNSQFALSPASGKQTIVVTDKAGNETRVTVTVNDGHTYEWQSENGQYWQKCKFCNHETAKKDIPTINISGADKVCRTQDYKFSFTLPEGATGAAYGYKFIGFSDDPLTPIVENGLYSGIIKASAYPATENSFKLIVSAKTADGFAFSAEKKVTIQNEHSGGTATCKDKAICEVCGESYGKLDPNNHANLKHIDAKAATKTSEGNIEYWYCDGCNKYYKDAKATQEITKAQTVTAKLPPKITAGDGATVTQGEKKELSFTSDASFSDFLRVELDGTTLDEKNYTKKEGSTIITLNRDFVATLSVGEDTLSIVSKSGTATAKFTVKAKPTETTTPQPTVTPQPTAQPQPTVQPVSPIPRTGDTANPALWFALLIVSGSALAAIFVLRRKDNRK